MLRLVGLWQQFQQARLSVDRLGDLMNTGRTVCPWCQTAQDSAVVRCRSNKWRLKYAEDLPLVYENLSLEVAPVKRLPSWVPLAAARVLAKLLQGFYQPSAGRISVDGVDIRYLSANNCAAILASYPETTLFSGTICDNLQMASPDASFEQITAACQMAEIHQTIEALPKGCKLRLVNVVPVCLVGKNNASLSHVLC